MNVAVTQLLDRASEAWAEWMLEMAWQVAVVVAVVAAAGWLLRRRSAAFRHTLWLLVLVRLVVPPDLAFPTGWGWWLRAAEPHVAASDQLSYGSTVPNYIETR